MLSNEEIEELVMSLRQSSIAYNHLLQKWIGAYGITYSQVRVLRLLKETGPSCLVEIGKELEISNSSLSGMIDRLERLDLVCRERDDKDRRVVWIRLSEKCQELMGRLPTIRAQFFRERLGQMDPDDVRTLTEKLKQFVQILNDNENKMEQ